MAPLIAEPQGLWASVGGCQGGGVRRCRRFTSRRCRFVASDTVQPKSAAEDGVVLLVALMVYAVCNHSIPVALSLLVRM